MTTDVEDANEIVVGRYYLVPTVIIPGLPKRCRIVPVIGPLHEDAEFINFPHRHYHPDRRFVSQTWLDFYNWNNPQGHWSPVYAFEIDGRITGMIDNGRRRMKCLRTVSEFRKDAPWLQKLERAYSNETLRDGHICPHRGISCRGVVVDSEGCAVCPGHGLRFNLKTGQLVSRLGQTFQLTLL